MSFGRIFVKRKLLDALKKLDCTSEATCFETRLISIYLSSRSVLLFRKLKVRTGSQSIDQLRRRDRTES